jgi:site-specific DNA recombinase
VGALIAEDLDRVSRDPRDLEDLIDAVRATRAYAAALSGSLAFTAGGTDAEISQTVQQAFSNAPRISPAWA